MDILTMYWLVLLGSALLLILGLAFLRLTVVATIASFSWIRQVWLEKYVWVDEDSLYGFPEGSCNQRKEVESYMDYVRVRDDTTTTTDSDGRTTTTTTPVHAWVTGWRTRYFYTIQRWINSRQLYTLGNDRNPYWPSYVLDKNISERVRTTREKYLVHFQSSKGKPFQRQMPEDAWAHCDERATYILTTTVFGFVTRVKPKPDQQISTPDQQQPGLLVQQQKRIQ